ncbi:MULTISPECIES: DUF3427 domain-containing protein [Paenibacillus]|uniref:DUF3427 domain-containing protein n=1 Tax=Paenibacillus TaxID=44249 RepID=UPI0013523081|nr:MULTISPECIES: DUF3427 domain-containing protein [Paenibacillus]MDY8025806.1 DUF3427 domain-containing protein [Paenibacillus polymyxa]MXO77702.1 DUF3427 domain-containing protein [Paenibacillus sp. OT2-17]
MFKIGEYYTRKDIYRIVNVPADKQGGHWDTGYAQYNDDFFIFSNINTAGRTGHDYPNSIIGNDLNWYAKNRTNLNNKSIQRLLNLRHKKYVFVREDSSNPEFLYLGNARVRKYFDTSPVNIIWAFDDVDENHPEILAEEINQPEKYFEGVVKQVQVNVFERNPIARRKCIEYLGLNCTICGFNFSKVYGEIGEDFIHIHHLKPLHEVGQKYEVDPVKDLCPVCPNCHAMLHKREPAYSIAELKKIIQKQLT